MVRWQIYDWNGSSWTTYTFVANPSAMDSPYRVHTTAVEPASLIDGRHRERREFDQPWPWGWSGRIRTRAFYDALQGFYDAGKKVYLVDHLSRVWLVRFTNFDPTPRQTRADTAWRFDYEAKVLTYDGPLTEVPTSP